MNVLQVCVSIIRKDLVKIIKYSHESCFFAGGERDFSTARRSSEYVDLDSGHWLGHRSTGSLRENEE